MNLDREMAVKAMQNLGWYASREKRGKAVVWRFHRPDTGGLHDVVTVHQDQISMFWVAGIAMRYDDAQELVAEINAAKDRWLQGRFVGIFSNEVQP